MGGYICSIIATCWKQKCPLPFFSIIFLSKPTLEETFLCYYQQLDEICSHLPVIALLLKAGL